MTSARRGSEVAVCSPSALAAGVRAGMPLAEAQALVPTLVAFPRDAARDRQALVKLAEACERFSPCVALEEGDEPESLLLDVTGLDALWGSEARLVNQLQRFVSGYSVRLAVADTVGAAWALAHFSEKAGQGGNSELQNENCKLQSGNPSDSQPSTLNPQPSAPRPALPAPYARLPVEALRLARDTVALLNELGIETIEQLQALPRDALTARFGEELLRRIDQLTGAAEEIIEPHRALPSLAVRHALEQPTADRTPLRYVLEQLVHQLAKQLEARDQGAILLVCLLRGAGGSETPLQIGLLQPSANARQLLELIELHLERLALPEAVDQVELRAAVVGRLGERQGELFDRRWTTNPHQLAVLINRLSSRLGCEQVLRAQLRASPVPERAVRYASVTQQGNETGRQEDKETRRQGDRETGRRGAKKIGRQSRSPCFFPPRPLLLYPEPQALEVVCVAPDGPPRFVWIERRRARITQCVGPERIETLWWRGASVRRDYYRITTETGAHWWIFRRLADARWFLHGCFD